VDRQKSEFHELGKTYNGSPEAENCFVLSLTNKNDTQPPPLQKKLLRRAYSAFAVLLSSKFKLSFQSQEKCLMATYIVGHTNPAKQTSVQSAAKVRFEPNPVIVVLCCERTQRENCGTCKISVAAAQPRNQSFMPYAAKPSILIHKSRNKIAAHL